MKNMKDFLLLFEKCVAAIFVVICSNRVICCFHKVILLYVRCLDTASIRPTKINRSREDLDVTCNSWKVIISNRSYN